MGESEICSAEVGFVLPLRRSEGATKAQRNL